MRTREKGYDDYGLTKERVAELKGLCKSKDATTAELLYIAAYAAKPPLAEDIILSLSEGISYERLWYIKNVYAKQTDFDAYKRKTLYYLDKLLKETEKD